MRKHWYSVFLILGVLLALFPPQFDLGNGKTTYGFFGSSPWNWIQLPTFIALEALCIAAFVVFAFRKSN